MKEYRKVIVSVEARFDTDGSIFPRMIVWEDGTKFEIDRVLEAKRAASMKAGGIGTRYTVRIQGRERFLWYEDPIWFVEAPVIQ